MNSRIWCQVCIFFAFFLTSASATTIIGVHGFQGNLVAVGDNADFDQVWSDTCNKNGMSYYGVNYANNHVTSKSLEIYESPVAEAIILHGDNNTWVAVHSMANLIVDGMMQNNTSARNKVNGIILFDGVTEGVPESIDYLLTFLGNNFDTKWQSVKDMQPRSGYINGLNEPSCRLIVVRGWMGTVFGCGLPLDEFKMFRKPKNTEKVFTHWKDDHVAIYKDSNAIGEVLRYIA
jgi:hypothetical protein